VIVIGIAAPSMATFVSRNQVVSVKSTFATSVALARSEAARTGIPVVLHAAGSSVGNEFADGWDLYLDVDLSGSVSNGDTLLRHYEALPASIRLRGGTDIVFNASGYLSSAANPDYTVCRSDGSTAGYAVAVAPSGLTYVAPMSSCSS
jgi:type IV fimbrial biogenesis protein FimT